MKQKLFVLSLDALVHEDIAYLEEKTNFSRLMRDRAEVERVRSILPGVTYPAHTTLMTGCYPAKHGIYDSQPFSTLPKDKTRFHVDADLVRVENLFAAAVRADCTTASVYWPITANDPNVDYNINEYFFYFPEDPEALWRRMGANEETLAVIRDNLATLPLAGSAARAAGHTFDDFIVNCTCDLIHRYTPDVMLVHVCPPDTARHHHGVFSEGLYRALDRCDEYLGQIMDAMEDAGVLEQTNFVILSDHGQLSPKKFVNLNLIFLQHGLLGMATDGSVYSWSAWADSNSMSANIYLRDPNDRRLYDRVHGLLQALIGPEYGIAAVDTAEECREKFGLYGPFSFVVRCDTETAIINDLSKPLFWPINDGSGLHGHDPDLGPRPVFLAHGPAFSHGAVLSDAELVDIAPTLAAVLGQEMPQADGRVLEELLR